MKTVVSKNSQNPQVSTGATPASPDAGFTRAPEDTTADPSAKAPATPPDGARGVTQPQPTVATPPEHRYRKWLLLAGTVAALVVGGFFLVPWVDTALNTVSTDDAYVNGPSPSSPRACPARCLKSSWTTTTASKRAICSSGSTRNRFRCKSS